MRVTGVGDLLESSLSNYHVRDDVARLQDLDKFLMGDMTEEEQLEKGFCDFDAVQSAYEELTDLLDALVVEAIENF